MIMGRQVPEGTECIHMMTTGCAECHVPHRFRSTGEWESTVTPDGILQHPAPGWAEMASHAVQAQNAELGPWIEARFHGTCRGCGGPTEPGEMIRHSRDEDGWLCSECGRD